MVIGLRIVQISQRMSVRNSDVAPRPSLEATLAPEAAILSVTRLTHGEYTHSFHYYGYVNRYHPFYLSTKGLAW